MSLLDMKIQSTQFNDLYTPRHAVTPILKYIKQNSTIWCPFDTEKSEFVKCLTEAGHNVIFSHIDYNQDFFTFEPTEQYDYIISNPPYSIKDRILTRLYQLNKPFMMLLPLTSLEGKYRNSLYEKYGIQLLVLDKRIDFTGKNANYFNTSYFCWNILPNQIIFEKIEIDPTCAKQQMKELG